MKTTFPSIQFHYVNGAVFLTHRTALKSFICKLFKKESIHVEELHYIFCSDHYLLQLNKDFLKHDTYTDIITFTLSESNTPIIGDIYISTDRVRENAKAVNTTFTNELHRVVFHGALHLCGYKDKTKTQKALMRQKEDACLQQYFVSRETL
jgi:rRNA maturation RNase YbeY